MDTALELSKIVEIGTMKLAEEFTTAALAFGQSARVGPATFTERSHLAAWLLTVSHLILLRVGHADMKVYSRWLFGTCTSNLTLRWLNWTGRPTRISKIGGDRYVDPSVLSCHTRIHQFLVITAINPNRDILQNASKISDFSALCFTYR